MYFITFTRKLGSNGSEIARRVAAELQYSLYDTETIENTASEMGFLEDVKQVDEKMPSLFERLFTHRPEVYLDRLSAVIYELASRGNAVFLGRGSHMLLRAFPCALHVRVSASLDKRIHNLMDRGFDRESAAKAVHKSDHERGAFIKYAFGVYWDNAELYDLVINTDNLSVDLAVATVLGMARSEEIQARSVDAMKSLGMMALVRKAEAALIEAGFPSSTLSVSVPEPGRVQLTGSIADRVDVTRAEEALKAVKGVESIDNQLQVATRLRHA